MRRHPPFRLERALLGLGVGLLLLGGIEVGLRIAGVSPAYQRDRIGQWRLAPGLRAAESQGPRDARSFFVSTNDEGLRTTVPRARGSARRVVLLGDSVVFGWGVDDGETLADGAQARLGTRWEVLNAGQPGYSTVMASWLYLEEVDAWKPDVVVVFVPQHDANRVLVSDLEYLSGGRSPVAALRVWLARESRLYEVLRRAADPQHAEPWLMPDARTTEPRVPRASDDERALALTSVRQRLGERGARLAVGFLPAAADLATTGGPAPDRPGYAWARAWTTAEGVPFADLRACCPGAAQDYLLPDDPGHFSPRGNLAIGAALGDWLSASFGQPESTSSP